MYKSVYTHTCAGRGVGIPEVQGAAPTPWAPANKSARPGFLPARKKIPNLCWLPGTCAWPGRYLVSGSGTGSLASQCPGCGSGRKREVRVRRQTLNPGGVIPKVKPWEGSATQAVRLTRLILLKESGNFWRWWLLRSGSEELSYRHATEEARKSLGQAPTVPPGGR